MRDVANRGDAKGQAARTRLAQITGDQGYRGYTNLSTIDIRKAYKKVRELQKKTYKAQRLLMPKSKAETVWEAVEKILEDNDESWDPYPDGEEGTGED